MIAIGSDHAGFGLKSEIIKFLEDLKLSYFDVGTNSEKSTDYPIYAYKASQEIVSKRCTQGIVICGTGVGISIACNKVKGIRCVVCSDCYSAKMSKNHNNANVLALGSRVVGIELAKMIVKTWLEAEYEEDRHRLRVNQIMDIENDNFNI